MPQYTLLTIVTDMLVRVNSEGVTSVQSGSTTDDGLIAVNLVNQVYEDLLNRYKWKHLKSFKVLTAGSAINTLKGTTGEAYVDGYNVYYGTINEENKISYVTPEEFVRRTIGRDTTDANIVVLNGLKIQNDQDPTFYTSINDTELVFDSMPSGAGLVAGNSKAFIMTYPSSRVITDSGTFNLPIQLQPYFRDLCVAEALEVMADEDTKADKMRKKAEKNISKIAYAGKFVEHFDDPFKYLQVRSGANYYQRNITNGMPN
jgi:hypothetical protein